MPTNKSQFADISSGRQNNKMSLKKKLLIALCIVVIVVCALAVTATICLLYTSVPMRQPLPPFCSAITLSVKENSCGRLHWAK